jgi:hypothetical protein
MTSVIGLDTNELNQWYFSSCSRAQLRNSIISSSNRISARYTCLTNNPRNTIPEVEYDYSPYLPGQIWTVDHQCQVATNRLNSSATACGVS